MSSRTKDEGRVGVGARPSRGLRASLPGPLEAAAAVTAGLLSGLFGVGGGIVLVPMLVFVAGAGQREAQALSLAAIVPISALGAASYAFSGRVDYVLSLALAGGGLIGVYWGTGLMARVSDRGLRVMFGVFMLVAAALMVAL